MERRIPFPASHRRSSVAFPPLLVLLVILGACSEQGPQAGPLASMEIVSGNEQADTVGHELPDPLLVRVKDANDQPVALQIVNFVVTAGGGSVFGGANSTNADGIAQERWTLGTNTADSQIVEVRAVDNTTGEPKVFARFRAAALPDVPAVLSLVSGDAQAAAVGDTLTDSVVVRLVDQYGNGTPGKSVGWQVVAGGGAPLALLTTTDDAGRTGNRWVLGARLDTTQVLEATIANVSPVRFTATPKLAPLTTLTLVAGNGQTDTVGHALSAPIIARVALADDRPVEGATVSWAGEGSFTPSQTLTDTEGQASAVWTLATGAGTQEATATVAGITPVTFTAMGVPDVPATILKVEGDSQVWLVNKPLPDSVVVHIEDAYGNPVTGVDVTWQVVAGAGQVTAGSGQTDGGGRGAAAWTLGTSLGIQQLQVSAGSVNDAFTATAREPLVAATAGGLHTCALITSGDAYCWGSNDHGQVGDGTGTARLTPVAVSGGLTFSQLAAGFTHTCGLTSSGAAYCWGYNVYGALGDGTTTARSTPVAVSGGFTFSRVAAGEYHTCGLTTSGDASCWGYNAWGGLGDGTTTTRSTPVAVSGGLTFSQLAAGGYHTCGLTNSGAAYCWGDNEYGQLGDGTTTDRSTPVAVSGGLTFSQLAAGYTHTCGLTSSGAAYCWGHNDYGQLGDGTATSDSTPVAVSTGLTFSQLTAGTGGSHTCGLTSSGAAYCWGHNDYGQLGDGTVGTHWTPVAVSGGLTFSQLAAGDGHTCGLTSSGAAYCWGEDAHGELGDNGTIWNKLSPVRSWP